jgi:hypothetical protein
MGLLLVGWSHASIGVTSVGVVCPLGTFGPKVFEVGELGLDFGPVVETKGLTTDWRGFYGSVFVWVVPPPRTFSPKVFEIDGLGLDFGLGCLKAKSHGFLSWLFWFSSSILAG